MSSNSSINKILEQGQEVTIKIPFTFYIGEQGVYSDKTLETIKDCLKELQTDINTNGINDSTYIEVDYSE